MANKENHPRFLIIDEDGRLLTSSSIPPEVFEAHDAGIWDIVDLELRLVYVGSDQWDPIELLNINEYTNNDNNPK